MKSKEEIQDDVLKQIAPLKRCGVALSVGIGKTLLGLRHMNSQYNDFSKFLVVAPKKSILKSWVDEAVKFKLSHLIPQIQFTTYLSLKKQSLDYDTVYLDEAHNLKFGHEAWLNWYKGNIVGLTGTPPKSQYSEHYKMVEKYCPIVYTYLTDNAIDDDILNDYKIIVHYLNLDERKNIKVEKKGMVWYASELSTYNYWTNRLDEVMGKDEQICRIMRMKCLMDFRSKEVLAKEILDECKDKTIVFANSKIQADRVWDKSYHSGNNNSERNLGNFKTGAIDKLSAVLQLSEGINIPKLKELIIMHSYSSGSAKLPQRIGRGLRLNPDDLCTVHILCYRNTVDEDWVRESLKSFDQSKIEYR